MSDALRAASNARDGEIETCASHNAAVLCQFQARISDICDHHDIHPTALIDRFEQVNARFENLVNVNETGRIIRHEARQLTRIIAREFDTYSL
jgi:oxygen-independent coproporphyrinogen-3 oxidase